MSERSSQSGMCGLKGRLASGVAAGVIAMTAMAGSAAAGDFLILKNSLDNSVSGLKTTMEGLGHTVTLSESAPSSFSGYDQVWDLRIQTSSGSLVSAYQSYLQSGGVVVAVGEHSGFSSRNTYIINGVSAVGGGSLAYTTPNKIQAVTLTGDGVPAQVDFDASENYDGANAFGGSTTAASGFFVTKDADGNGTIIAFDAGSLSTAAAGRGMVVFDINMFDRTDADLTALVEAMIRYLTGDLTQQVASDAAQETVTQQDQVVVRSLSRLFGSRITALRGPSGFRQTQVTMGHSSQDESERQTGFSAGDSASYDLSGLGLWADASRSSTEGEFGAVETDGNVYAFTAGADYVFAPAMVGGLALTYETGSNDFSDGGESDNKAGQATIYGAWQANDWLMPQAFVGYGIGDNDLTTVQLGNAVSGKFDSRRFMASVGAKAFHTLDLPENDGVAQGVDLTGGLSYNYSISWLDDYTASNGQTVTQGSAILSQAVASVEAALVNESIQPFVGFSLERDLNKTGGGDMTGGYANLGARIAAGDNGVATIEAGTELMRSQSKEHSIAASFRYVF